MLFLGTVCVYISMYSACMCVYTGIRVIILVYTYTCIYVYFQGYLIDFSPPLFDL